MKPNLLTIGVAVITATMAVNGVAWAKRAADDPRRKCREAIQKATGAGKDAKVSAKAIDRCVANGGQI